MTEDKSQKKVIDQINTAFKDLVKAAFGEKGVEFVDQVQKQTQEFSASAVKSFVEFTDKVLESTKLNENELVKKSSSTVKDLLKQSGLLAEESEDDF
jgi:hypothetical protein